MKKKTKLIIDMNNLCYIALYSISITDENLKSNEIKQNFFDCVLYKIYNYIKELDIKNICLCWDTKTGISWRKEVYPGYKQNRKNDKNKEILEYFFNDLLPELKDILFSFPINNFSNDLAEADDLIYGLCNYFKEEEEILVISRDGDFKQLLLYFDNVLLYNPIAKKYEEKPDENFLKLKAIVGDKSDNIPGLYRIGEKKAISKLNNFSNWSEKEYEDFYKFYKIIDLKQFKYCEQINNYIENYFIKKQYIFEPHLILNKFYKNSLVNQYNRWSNNIEIINYWFY